MVNSEYSIGRWVSILYRYGQGFVEREMKQYGLGSGQFIFLILLLKRDGVRQEELAGVLNIDKATTARAVKKLEEKGYVLRRVVPEDRRARVIYVTEKGRQLEKAVQKTSEMWTDMLTAGFTDEEKKTVIDLMKRMSQKAAVVLKD